MIDDIKSGISKRAITDELQQFAEQTLLPLLIKIKSFDVSESSQSICEIIPSVIIKQDCAINLKYSLLRMDDCFNTLAPDELPGLIDQQKPEKKEHLLQVFKLAQDISKFGIFTQTLIINELAEKGIEYKKIDQRYEYLFYSEYTHLSIINPEWHEGFKQFCTKLKK